MNIMNIENVSKHYGERTILDKVSLGINEGDKLGIIGLNGTGKTTLLKLMAGLEEPDEGQVVKGNKIAVSYLPQNPVFSPSDTVLDAVCAGGKLPEAKAMLNRLGITSHEALMGTLSGGQRKRAALAAALLMPCEVLIMDEPTNHLDGEMILWLENYLTGFKGQIIMVTHDRYFLDRVTNKIVELDRGKLYTYAANYSGFLEAKAEREDIEAAAERKRQNILRTELAWIRRGCQARSTKQQARIDRFEDMREASRRAREKLIKHSLELSSIASRVGRKTVEINKISKSCGDKVLFRDFTHILLQDERIGVVGPNGCGKSTLLRIICGDESPDGGTIEYGETIRIGFFRQENENLDENCTVLEHVKNIGEYVSTADGRISASRMCERFLFTPAMQHTRIARLSGGEKRRLALLSVLMEAPNVLVLDEPTNDLDIGTLAILEDYLDSFAGMVIVVSHDRFFLDRIAERIFAFEGNGVITRYEGGYTDYLEKAGAGRMIAGPGKDKPAKENRPQNYKSREEKLRFTYSEQKEYETIEDEIANLEARLLKCEEQINEAATQYARLAELAAKKEKLAAALSERMDRWVYLSELAERIEGQKNSTR